MKWKSKGLVPQSKNVVHRNVVFDESIHKHVPNNVNEESIIVKAADSLLYLPTVDKRNVFVKGSEMLSSLYINNSTTVHNNIHISDGAIQHESHKSVPQNSHEKLDRMLTSVPNKSASVIFKKVFHNNDDDSSVILKKTITYHLTHMFKNKQVHSHNFTVHLHQ